MIRIDHIAIWCDSIELLRDFYTRYFDCRSGALYRNERKGYASYFLTFEGGGARIELMHRTDISACPPVRGMTKGLAHLCLTVGSRADVDAMVERLRRDGHIIAGECRTTGDGYYEAIVLDPEGNYVEICAEK